jgi:hypothetical protein
MHYNYTKDEGEKGARMMMSVVFSCGNKIVRILSTCHTPLHGEVGARLPHFPFTDAGRIWIRITSMLQEQQKSTVTDLHHLKLTLKRLTGA